MSPKNSAHHHLHSEHSHNSLSLVQRRIAVFSAILAAGIAILSIWGDILNREVFLARDTASNFWSYFHEKSLKERIYESELSFATDLSNERVAELQAEVQRYQDEQVAIRTQAEEKEAEVMEILHKVHYVEVATIFLELAIILSSISLVVALNWLTWLAILTAVGGALAAVAGFALG